jgi:hypothetical protein
VSARTARATQRNPVSKNQKKKKVLSSSPIDLETLEDIRNNNSVKQNMDSEYILKNMALKKYVTQQKSNMPI